MSAARIGVSCAVQRSRGSREESSPSSAWLGEGASKATGSEPAWADCPWASWALAGVLRPAAGRGLLTTVSLWASWRYLEKRAPSHRAWLAEAAGGKQGLPSEQQFLCLLTVCHALSSCGQVATLHHASVSLFCVTGGNVDLPRAGRMRGQQFVPLADPA